MYEDCRNSGEGGGNKSPTTLILPGLEIKSKDYYMNPQIVRPSYGPAFELCRRPESLTNCGHDNQRLNQKKKNSYTWLHWSSKSKDNVVGSLNPDSSDFVIGSKKNLPRKNKDSFREG